MSSETAQVVLAIITSIEAIVWLFGLRFLYVSSRRQEAEQQDDAGEVALPGEGREGWLRGSVEVEGHATTLAARAAAILAKGVKILEKTDHHIRFERIGLGRGNRGENRWFQQGEMHFTPL